MLVFLQFIILLFILYLFSRSITKNLSLLMHTAFHSQKLSVYIIAIILFPGTVVHEFAHFLMAHLLFVPTKDMEFMPKIHGDQIKLGSVKIARTDPFRRMLIGVAPLFAGLGLIFVILYSLITTGRSQDIFFLCLAMVGVFLLCNTMFPSRKDMEGSWPFVIAIGLLVAFFGIYLLREPEMLGRLQILFDPMVVYVEYGNRYLFLATIIDGIFLLILKLIYNLQTRKTKG